MSEHNGLIDSLSESEIIGGDYQLFVPKPDVTSHLQVRTSFHAKQPVVPCSTPPRSATRRSLDQARATDRATPADHAKRQSEKQRLRQVGKSLRSIAESRAMLLRVMPMLRGRSRR